MRLFAVVYQDDLEKYGRSVVYFNTRTPNSNFRHYAVLHHKKGQQHTVEWLLAKIRQDYPQAHEETRERSVWIVSTSTLPI